MSCNCSNNTNNNNGCGNTPQCNKPIPKQNCQKFTPCTNPPHPHQHPNNPCKLPNPSHACGSNIKNTCCNGKVMPKFNVAKSQTLCCYVDRIYDENVSLGSAIYDTITTDTLVYSTNFYASNTSALCCTPCNFSNLVNFYVNDCTESKLESLIPGTTITASNVFVNGVPVKSITQNPDGSYTATVDEANEGQGFDCDNNSLGTKSTLLISNIGNPWNYVASHEIYGTINTNGQCYNFKIDIENTIPEASTTSTSTFMLQDLCIPFNKGVINFKIDGDISLVNPIITYDTIANIPVVSGNVVITPRVDVQVLQKTKAYIQAIFD